MRPKVLLALISICSIFVNAGAQSLTLEQCKEKAYENYPAIKQYALIEKSSELNVSNAMKSWLPGVSVMGGAAFYTDLMEGSQMAQALDMKNNLYGAVVNVNQVIYDGGAISAKKKIVEAQSNVEQSQLNVTMYDVKSRVEEIYFGILTLDEQIRQNALLQEDLNISVKCVTSMIEDGVANQNDLDQVNVRLIEAKQQAIALNSSRNTYLNMLGYFIGEDLNDNAKLEKPESSIVDAESYKSTTNRPEMELFNAQQSLLQAHKKSLNAKLMPTIGAFGAGAYHNKIVSGAKESLLAAGITLKWNIGALYTRRNDLSNISNQSTLIESQKETFLFNNQLQSQKTNGVIEKLQKQMQMDDEVVTLRERLHDSSELKLQNGTESVNEYLRSVNAVSEARQQKALHEIQLLFETYKLKTLKNL